MIYLQQQQRDSDAVLMAYFLFLIPTLIIYKLTIIIPYICLYVKKMEIIEYTLISF